MKVYITDKYLDYIEDLISTPSTIQDVISGRQTNLHALFNLLHSLPLVTDLPQQKLVKYFKDISGGKQYSSLKQQLIANALKNNRIYSSFDIKGKDDIQNLSAYYFINDINAASIESETGTIAKSGNEKFQSFYNSCTHAGTFISDNWEPISDNIPPANAIVIIDQYIFKENNNNTVEQKTHRLIDLLQRFKKQISVKFQATILFRSYFGRKDGSIAQHIIDSAYHTITAAIPDAQIELVTLTRDYPLNHDRIIYSNYMTVNIGIPFEARPTVYNQNFLGVEFDRHKVEYNYAVFKQRLKELKKMIANRPFKQNDQKQKWQPQNEFTNRLFDNLD